MYNAHIQRALSLIVINRVWIRWHLSRSSFIFFFYLNIESFCFSEHRGYKQVTLVKKFWTFRISQFKLRYLTRCHLFFSFASLLVYGLVFVLNQNSIKVRWTEWIFCFTSSRSLVCCTFEVYIDILKSNVQH